MTYKKVVIRVEMGHEELVTRWGDLQTKLRR